jgi:glycolate oxidase FAD binding subunit
VSSLTTFAADAGPASAGPVVAVGGRTQWDVGGLPGTGAREVRAPVGVVTHEPAEMTVRVGAGTTLEELGDALAPGGQRVTLPVWPGATVGGVLAVGRAGVERLGWGPARDAVLEIRYVSADGDVVKAGGPTVKNVSGYDLVRLLVGSLGTLGLIGEVVLRTRPRPDVAQWFAAEGADPWAARAALHHPSAVLWDGTTTWILLEGQRDDVKAQAAAAGMAGGAVEGPPPLPANRWSLPPGDLRSLPHDGDGPFVAEVGVGVVHRDRPQPARPVDQRVAALNARVKAVFDPTGRLGPGRTLP